MRLVFPHVVELGFATNADQFESERTDERNRNVL